MKNNLRVYRAKSNITQEELADAVDVTRQTIIAIEAERYNPSLELVFKLAKYFNVKIEDLFKPD